MSSKINRLRAERGKNDEKIAVLRARNNEIDKQITELSSRITQTLPTRMSLAEQSAFQLGYYHETQRLYTAKTNKEEQ